MTQQLTIDLIAESDTSSQWLHAAYFTWTLTEMQSWLCTIFRESLQILWQIDIVVVCCKMGINFQCRYVLACE